MGTTHTNYTLCSDHKLLFTAYCEKDLKMLLPRKGGGGGGGKGVIHTPSSKFTPH